jgi:hypothetical protein
MPLVSVSAVYDGKEVQFLETPPIKGPYRVLVTFVEPASEPEEEPQDLSRFWSSFGAWQDGEDSELSTED